jgi:hypothetical protein
MTRKNPIPPFRISPAWVHPASYLDEPKPGIGPLIGRAEARPGTAIPSAGSGKTLAVTEHGLEARAILPSSDDSRGKRFEMNDLVALKELKPTAGVRTKPECAMETIAWWLRTEFLRFFAFLAERSRNVLWNQHDFLVRTQYEPNGWPYQRPLAAADFAMV